MKWVGVKALALALAASGLTVPASAQTDMIDQVEDEQANLLHKFPALRTIDRVIRDDCAAKKAGVSAKSGFCRCAAAVTMTLWFSGMDSKMAARLQAFIDHPTDGSEFLTYQGPELYATLCRHA